jgi:hypothetical protein
VEQLTILVSSEGRWVLPEGDEFLAALGDPSPDYDATGFAVRNLGYIKFEVLDKLVTEIELHPRNVSPHALDALETQLRKPGTNLFRIKYLDSEWRSEISASAEHTISRLRELCAPHAEAPSTERFRITPQDALKLSRDFENPLRLLSQKWRASFGRFDSTVISFAIQNGLLSRLMITGVRPHLHDAIFRFIGDGYKWLGKDYKINALGENIENQPDKEYGAWVSEFYKGVAASGEPRYDLVAATIQNTGTKVPYVARYERLLLPWKTPTDEVFVTSTSKVVERDLDWEASVEGDSPLSMKSARSS